ncbi:MAG: MlaD family protein [Gammaproteobacteria bacterium]
MNNRAYALATGIFVLLLGTAVIVAAVWLGGTRRASEPYVVVTTGSVAGLVPHSTIFFRGITAGHVTSIRFDPADPRKILIGIDVDRGTPVTRDTYAVLGLQGLTGASQLDLETTGSSTELLPTSARAPAEIALRPSLLGKLSDAAPELMQQLQQIASALNALLDAGNRAHVAKLIAQADQASAGLVKLEADLDAEARRLPPLTAHLQTTLGQVDALAASLGRLSSETAELARTGRDAGHTLNAQTLPRLDVALQQISAAAAELRRLSASLRANPQQLLSGRERPAPGPGEPGYKGGSE